MKFATVSGASPGLSSRSKRIVPEVGVEGHLGAVRDDRHRVAVGRAARDARAPRRAPRAGRERRPSADPLPHRSHRGSSREPGRIPRRDRRFAPTGRFRDTPRSRRAAAGNPMIRIDSISKRHGRQILFLEASAVVNRGEKIGLVGPNGAGKTTIFRLIAREEEPDGGQVAIDRGVTIGYFSQDVGEMERQDVVEAAIDGAGAGLRGRAQAPRARARARRSRARRRDRDADRALRRGAGALRGARRLRARGARARGPRRPRLRGRRRWTATSARSRAAGRCASRSRASCSCSPTRCSSTSPPTTSTSSRSSGSSTACATSRARS